MSPGAENILRVIVEHAKATSLDGDPNHGHNEFRPDFNRLEGPAIFCIPCEKWLPLPPL